MRALVVLAVLLTGCATTRGVPLPVAAPVLVVAADADDDGDAEAREADALRALTQAPVRAWPGDAEPALWAELSGDGAERVERARAAAEERRLPWLLVLDEDGVWLETTRHGDVVWRARGRRRGDAGAAAALRRWMRDRDGAPFGPARLASAEELGRLRRLAARGEFEAWGEATDALWRTYRGDPAVLTHAHLYASLFRSWDEDLDPALDIGRSLVPHAESEYLAIALAAQAAGSPGFASKVWRVLVDVYPERLDYHRGLADVLDLLELPEEALAACRGGRAQAPRDAILAIPKGTPPDARPDALPYADLAFCEGYFLFEDREWELAALAYEDAITIYEATDRFEELGEALNNAGVAMVQADRPLIGSRTLRKAVDVREELGASLPLANSRYNLGRALDEAGRPGPARLSLERAAEDYRSAGAYADAIETLTETLDLHVQEGDRDGFERRGVAILAELEDRPESEERATLQGDAWFALGQGRTEFDDYEGSLAAFFRSLRLWQELGKKLEEGQTHYSMALPHLAMLELEEAWTDLVNALQISVDLGDSSSILAIRTQLAQIADLFDQAGREPPELPEALRRWVEVPGG